jgi:hypothetical protein
MEIPVQFASFRSTGLRVLAVLSFGALMAACASVPNRNALVGLGLDSSAQPALSSGRLTIEVRDENGTTMAGYMVDIGWDQPRFYRTRAFTDRNGRVSFSGVPDVAEVTINHDGGIYQQLLLVPQNGRAELPVMLNTQGGYQARLDAERERFIQQANSTVTRQR